MSIDVATSSPPRAGSGAGERNRKGALRRPILGFAVPALAFCLATSAAAQHGHGAPPDSTARDSAQVEAPAEEDDEPGWRFIHLNELETPFTTIRVGGGLLIDYNTFAQDDESSEQFDLDSETDFRDLRVIFRGRFKTERPITWQAGFMYDRHGKEWFVRQTGIIVAVPEISGSLWLGRSKEGVSLNRIMVGYDGWSEERFPFSDASIPLLADGVKWMGYAPNQNLIWNLGYFNDWLSEGQSFSYYRDQVAGRFGYVNFDSASAGNLVHVALGGRIGRPTDNSLRLKSKPEATFAPNFLDTGAFGSEWAGELGIEGYYRPGNWIFGAEYYVETADFIGTPEPTDEPDIPGPVDNRGLDPVLRAARSVAAATARADGDLVTFHGGGAVVTWLITGETRTYLTPSGSFAAVSPARPVTKGGPGAWEAVLGLSYTDLDSGVLEGGKFWRITPTLNWHFSDNLRFEIAYGYGSLDRFGTTGRTHFFQTRIQSQL